MKLALYLHVWVLCIYINLALYFGGKRSKGSQAQCFHLLTALNLVTRRSLPQFGLAWLGSSALICWDCFASKVLALQLALQRWSSALAKSHRWAALHLLHVSVSRGALLIASSLAPRRDWDSPDPRHRDAATALRCLPPGWAGLPRHRASPFPRSDSEAAVPVPRSDTSHGLAFVSLASCLHLQGFFFRCFFLYRYWEGLVLSCLWVWMRGIQCSVTEAGCGLATPNASREAACCDRGMAGTSYVLGRARTVSEGKIQPSGITCMRALNP